MRLTFPPSSDADHSDALDELIDSVMAFAEERGAECDPFPLHAALSYRLRSDGQLGRWRPDDIKATLLDWFPRKVTMPEPSRATVVPSLGLLLDYLAANGLLARGSGDPAGLRRTLAKVEPAFLAAMADEREYDVAKFWASRMLDSGVDMTDQAAVNRFIAAAQQDGPGADPSILDTIVQRQFPTDGPDLFAALAGVAGPAGIDGPDVPNLPVVRLPDATELAAAAAASTVTAQVGAFMRWLATGRAVTKANHLKLAAARELAGLLDTDREFLDRAASSADLPTIDLIVGWAFAAGLVRTVKGRLVPIKKSAPLLRQPVQLWQRLFGTVGELGEELCGGGAPDSESWLVDDLELVLPSVLMGLYTAAGSPIPLELLHDIVLDELGDDLEDDDEDDQLQLRLWRRDLSRIMGVMESLGAVHQEITTDPEELAAIAEMTDRKEPDPTMVAFTPIGIWGVHQMLQEAGIAAPVVGELVDAAFDAVAERLTDASEEILDAELTSWVQARGDGPAAKELTSFIQDTPKSTDRLLAFLALGHTGDAGTAAAADLRAAGGVAGALAATWLVDRGRLDPESIRPEEAAVGLVESLAAMHAQDCLIEELRALPAGDQVGLVRMLGEIDHPDRLAMLDTIAAGHPDRKVAKQAGKIRLRLRTAGLDR